MLDNIRHLEAPRPRGTNRTRLGGVIGVLAVIVVVIVATGPSVRSAAPSPAHASPLYEPPLAVPAKASPAYVPPPPALATLALGAQVAVTSSTFWGVVAQTASSHGISADHAIGSFLNDSPFQLFSYSQQPDQCNLTTGTFYKPSGATVHPCGYNMTDFKSWCDARGSSCQSIITLPGENNNSAEDAFIANWIVHKVGFQPTYWTIGNEPSLWTHYGIPWSQWTSTDASKPTPIAYAVDVRNAVVAVQKVDPSGQFLGIEADCQCSPTWFSAVGQVDGALIAGIAYHTYPSTARSTNETIGQLFQPLIGKTSVASSYAQVRSYFAQDCSRCATLPIFVTEYNSGPGWAPSQWAGKYPDAVFLAASATQALTANLTAFDIYYLQSDQQSYGWGMINNKNVLGPEGLLYKDILDHVVTGRVIAVQVATTVGNVWAVETIQGTHASLLIVNANTSRGISLSLSPVVVPLPKTLSTTYQWNPARPHPLTTSTSLLAGSFLVPVEGILLIDWTI